MIVVRIEMWPLGAKSRSRTLATAKITNTLTSSSNKLGDYKFEITLTNENKIWREGTIQGFHRKSKNVWYLLKLILEEIL